MSDRTARKIRVLYNPSSGYKMGLTTNRATEDDIRAVMARHGLGDDLVVSDDVDTATASVREAVAAGYDIVAAAGGDGTMASTATQLLGTQTALGILPLGSVMNVARMFDIPRDLDAAAAILAGGTAKLVDIAEANGTPFYEAGTVGLGAVLLEEGQRVDHGDWWGIFRSLRTLFRYRGYPMRVYLDDRRIRTRALMITVANGPYVGLAYTIAPDAVLDDGLLDVSIYDGLSRFELIRHFAAISFGGRDYSPEVETHRSRYVRIESRRPIPCRISDLDAGTTPITFTVRRLALRVMVPTVPTVPAVPTAGAADVGA